VARDIAIALGDQWRALARRGRHRTRGRSRGRGRSAADVRLLRKRIAIAVLAVALLGGGWLWLRDSSLVAANDLTITGLTGSDAPAIKHALENAAGDMTTLHVRIDALRTAVAPYPIVKDIRVETHFPHEMQITVIEHHPVAAVTIDGARVAVAADGTLLRGRAASTKLVTLDVPSANGGGRLTSKRGREAVAAMGAAPAGMRNFVQSVEYGPDGMRLQLRNGPLLEFGDATRARAKWIAAARVLGDPRGAGASYIDVRIPERPVAGRFDDGGGVALDGQTATDQGSADGTSTDSTSTGTSTDGTSTDGTTAQQASNDQTSTDGTSTDSTSADGTSTDGSTDQTSTSSGQ
jgi:cell division protein FtsQ